MIGLASAVALVIVAGRGPRPSQKEVEGVSSPGGTEARPGRPAFGVVRPEDARRAAIYAEMHRAGILAGYEAERRYPLAKIPTEARDRDDHIARHQSVYEALKREGRERLARKFGTDAAALDAIDREGDANRWPVKDPPRDLDIRDYFRALEAE